MIAHTSHFSTQNLLTTVDQMTATAKSTVIRAMCLQKRLTLDVNNPSYGEYNE
jgi:hypothetical protein